MTHIFVSPGLNEALASTETEVQVRARLSLVRSVIRCAPDKVCPFCGSEPGMATKRGDFWLVGCESDDCAINPQAGSCISQEAAWAKWNTRI